MTLDGAVPGGRWTPSLKQQITRFAAERKRRIYEFRVQRVLEILADESLTTAAALNLDSERGLIFECNFVREVWRDPRLTGRVEALAQRGIAAEVIEHSFAIGGHQFSRTQIQVRYR
jgi:hypothetical protein